MRQPITLLRESIWAFKISVGSLLLVAMTAGTSLSAPSREALSLDAPMRFVTFKPCAGNAQICGGGILAIGTIQPDSYVKLIELGWKSGTIFFHSPGGNLVGGLKLGRTIRALGLNTVTGGPVSEETTAFQPATTLVNDSICASACTFAFLGGKNREVVNDRSFMVHQFFTDLRSSPESVVQQTVAELNKYLDEMGIDRHLLDSMLTTEPSEVSSFSFSQLWKMRVYNASLTVGIPLGLTPLEESEQDGNWRLVFGAQDKPFLSLEQPTPNKNGVAVYVIQRSGDGYVFSFGAHWLSDNQAARRSEVWNLLRAGPAEPMTVQFWSPTDPYRNGPGVAFRVPPAEWKAMAVDKWFLSIRLTDVEMAPVKNNRTTYLQFKCGIPHSFVDFGFCEAVHTGRNFWRLFSLLN